MLPTGWTCAGLVQHLALDDERFWFRQVMTGEQVEPDEFGDDGWQVRPEVPAAAVLDLYRRRLTSGKGCRFRDLRASLEVFPSASFLSK